jgi:predicted  nucleic acid-binding Zn-ribbon protein
VTCAPLDSDGVRAQLEELRKEFPTHDAALKAQEQTARELKQKLEDAEKKREEVQKTLDKKIKERNTELKVLSKYQDGKASGLPT